ncbi:MAG TPA: type II and III secretion system protein family protein [Sphingomonadaceae bacterium]|nr:type II and III secretion system protein family protein [Sphingomonadaceae bacterium]
MIRSSTPPRVRATLGTALATVLALSLATLSASPAAAQNPAAVTPAETLNLSVGRGSMVRLNSPMTDLFVANDAVADVQVRSSTQLYLFGKGKGETTVYATDKSGRVVFSANVRVGQNISSVDDVLRLAMPEAAIEATPMNGIILLTGTVASPADVEEASRIVKAYVGEGTEVVTRLRTATPLQVNLRVKIAEVNRSLAKDIGVNFLSSSSNSNGFVFGAAQGSGIDPATGIVTVPSLGTVLRFSGKVLGLDILSTLNLAENDGLASTLAEPNLTALSGETASFLAGGEFPVPVSQGLGNVSVEYKQYGVSLAFTPYVLADGRISMRVRPEVSELSSEGSIRLNGFTVPAITTRRAETTVELGSGQSFMIGGLLRNVNTNTLNKAPWLGDLPILGALFRSNSFRRAETELVIIVTPYLVKPTSGRLATPLDGYRAPTDVQRVLGGQTFDGVSGARAPRPRVGPPQTVRPGIGVIAPRPATRTSSPAGKAAETPGFDL